ncbi:helix-turn-helix domain-containing protein [Myxococcus qinghaiensis]|uniref:helix-turn-helix domain-containing protein n=1 Tax=Myxococcus qinghaiensis TaxID=2906758 RepID=UPI0020A78AFF|nr:helix-turn-helix domain-containing protein [Myxococcus qinghaiensis]MCP3167832.1 helix-turn-helix domain-containing protein [Myxococcus qinghaiensis]
MDDARPDPNQLMTPSEAARILGLSPDMVRVLHRRGQLAAECTETGRRLFRRADVEALAAERAKNEKKGKSQRLPGGQG